jgi:23S rRNA pseudouridine2457 synthase
MLIAFNKPFGVVSQFTSDGSKHRTLADFAFPRDVYPLGRLDAETEGLLLLSDEPFLNKKLLAPENAHARTYWAQVERVPERAELDKLQRGLVVGGHRTLPCRSWILDPQPMIPPRDPPIRFRKHVPDCWVALSLVEGKNHQVRRMTAAIGHATLRLIRVRIGEFDLDGLAQGRWRELGPGERARVFAGGRKGAGPS